MNKNDAKQTALNAASSARTAAIAAAKDAKRRYSSFKAWFLAAPTMLADAKDEADELATRADVPHVLQSGLPVPYDLDDTDPRWWGVSTGGRLSGRLMLDDLYTGGPSPAEPLALGLVPAGALLFYVLGAFGAAGGPSGLGLIGVIAAAVFLACMAISWFATGASRTFIAALLSTVPLAGQSFIMVSDVGAAARDLVIFLGLILAISFFAGTGYGILSFLSGLHSRMVAMTKLWLAIVATAAVALGLAHIPMLHWLITPVLFTPAVLFPWIFAHSETMAFWSNVGAQDNIFGGETNHHADHHKTARFEQAEEAAKDASVRITLATASGLFTKKMDGYAPDAGKPIIFTLNDLSEHLIVFGSTGKGKTAGVLRPLLKQIAESSDCGLLVLDAKAQLASDVKGLKNYTVIEPGIQLGLLEGLSPQDVATAIEAVNEAKSSGASENGAFFINSGHDLLLNVLIVVKMLKDAEPEGSWKWTLSDVRRMIGIMAAADESSENTIGMLEKMLGQIKSVGERMTAEDAVAKLKEFSDPEKADDKTNGNIVKQVHSWIDPIFGNPDLVEWTRQEHGIDLSQIQHGQRFGVCLPYLKYGKAGQTISSLVKYRVYTGIRNRGDKWESQGEKPIVIVMDEAQGLISEIDKDFLAQARSLGGRCVFSTQTIEGFSAVIGEEPSLALLNNFRSFVMLDSSVKTYQYISGRLGTTERLKWKSNGQAIGFAQSLNQMAESAFADPSHPGAKWFQRLRRKGGGRFSLWLGDGANRTQATGIGVSLDGRTKLPMMDHRHRYVYGDSGISVSAVTEYEWEVAPLLKPEEADAYLQKKFRAVVSVQRGGVRRRDIAMLHPTNRNILGEVLDPETEKAIEAEKAAEKAAEAAAAAAAAPAPAAEAVHEEA